MNTNARVRDLKLRRRVFLEALGVGIAAPLAARLSRLAYAQGPRPVRLFMMFVPHGFPLEHFDPVGAGGGLELAAKGIGGWSPFEPYKASTTLVRGIGMANGATNHMAIRAALTGFPDGGQVDSIDYVIGQKLGLTPHVLGARPYDKGQSWSLNSYLNKHGGAWVRALESPVEASDQLFQGVGQPPGFDESPFEKAALELTTKQVARLQTRLERLTAEKTKLRIHLEALHNLKAAPNAAITVCSKRPVLPAVQALVGKDPLDPALFGNVLDAHLEVAANALVCGSARIVTLQTLWVTSDQMCNFPGGPGVAMTHHGTLSHMAPPREPYARVQRWFCQRLAEKLLAVLDRPDPADPAHTVLDNSIVYLTTEIADGSNHTSTAGPLDSLGLKMFTYLPQILIGGGGGYFKAGGRIVPVPDNRPHTDVLATIAAAMGVNLTRIGDEPVRVIEELKA